MARRRLTPTVAAASPAPEADVPRAEHSATLRPTLAAAAPIARVAGDAAGSAAFEEVSRALTQARETGRMVLDLPLDDIAPDHLLRDRIPVEDEEMAALRASIRAHGQRTPIEVTPLRGAGGSPLPYGLISGWRRLAALRGLLAETGEARFATVQALVRRPETVADAYVAMVEENEIRVGLSQYERARVAALAVKRGVFESEKAALLALFASASRPKRSRIRSFLEIYHALDGHLRFPAHLPERLGLRLVEQLRENGAAGIVALLERAAPETPEAELAALERWLEAAEPPPAPLPRPERTEPRTASERPAAAADQILPGVTLEQSFSGRTLTLRFKGQGVSPELADEIRAALAHLRD